MRILRATIVKKNGIIFLLGGKKLRILSWPLIYSSKKFIAEWETPVWQHLKNIHSVQQWGFHMFQGFHTFKPHQLSAACQYVSHLLLDNMLSRGVAGQDCTVLWVWGVKTPPPRVHVQHLSACRVHLRSQDSSYRGRPLAGSPLLWWRPLPEV